MSDFLAQMISWFVDPVWSLWVTLPVIILLSILLIGSYCWLETSGTLTASESRAVKGNKRLMTGYFVILFPLCIFTGVFLIAFPLSPPVHIFLESRSVPVVEVNTHEEFEIHRNELDLQGFRIIDAGTIVDYALTDVAKSWRGRPWAYGDIDLIKLIRRSSQLALDKSLETKSGLVRHKQVPRWVIESVEFAILKGLTYQENVESITVNRHPRTIPRGSSWTGIQAYLKWGAVKDIEFKSFDASEQGVDQITRIAGLPWMQEIFDGTGTELINLYVPIAAGRSNHATALRLFINGSQIFKITDVFAKTPHVAGQTFLQRVELKNLRLSEISKASLLLEVNGVNTEVDVQTKDWTKLSLKFTGKYATEARTTLSNILSGHHTCAGEPRIARFREKLSPLTIRLNRTPHNVEIWMDENVIGVFPAGMKTEIEPILEDFVPIFRNELSRFDDVSEFPILQRGPTLSSKSFSLSQIPLEPSGDGNYLVEGQLNDSSARPIVYVAHQPALVSEVSPVQRITSTAIGYEILLPDLEDKPTGYGYVLFLDAAAQGLFLGGGSDCLPGTNYNEARFFPVWYSLISFAEKANSGLKSLFDTSFDNIGQEPIIVMSANDLIEAKARLLRFGIILLCVGLIGHITFIIYSRIQHFRYRKRS